MNTCTTCTWRMDCNLRSSGNALGCIDWEPERKAPAIVGIALAMILGTLMWAALIYALPLLILAAKGFGR